VVLACVCAFVVRLAVWRTATGRAFGRVALGAALLPGYAGRVAAFLDPRIDGRADAPPHDLDGHRVDALGRAFGSHLPAAVATAAVVGE
jgi:hypothetical protein